MQLCTMARKFSEIGDRDFTIDDVRQRCCLLDNYHSMQAAFLPTDIITILKARQGNT